jgi:hypothetical protein
MNLLILDILFDSVSQFNAIAKIKASFWILLSLLDVIFSFWVVVSLRCLSISIIFLSWF